MYQMFKRNQLLFIVTIVQQFLYQENHVFHKKSKNIDTLFHLIRELVNDGDIVLIFCGSKDQIEDIFGK